MLHLVLKVDGSISLFSDETESVSGNYDVLLLMLCFFPIVPGVFVDI